MTQCWADICTNQLPDDEWMRYVLRYSQVNYFINAFASMYTLVFGENNRYRLNRSLMFTLDE